MDTSANPLVADTADPEQSGASALAAYVERIGGAELARQLGCSRQLVSAWKGRERISARMAIRVAQLPGAPTLAELRPQDFGAACADDAQAAA